MFHLRKLVLQESCAAVLLAAVLVLGAPEGAAAGEKPEIKVPVRTPAIASMFPLGAQAGTSVEIEAAGNFLDGAEGLRCECADVEAAILEGNALRFKARLTVAPGAPAGPRFLYLESPRGVSNRVMIRVTHWASRAESEPNDSMEQAEAVTAPAIIEGRAATITDSDMFRVRFKPGERLAFNVLTGRTKAPGHVALTLLDSQGLEVGRNLSRFGTDPYLEYESKDGGDYYVVITPRRFADFYTILSDTAPINWQYQLAIGRSPVLFSVYPMGGRRGSTVQAELRASFLDPGAEPRLSQPGLSAKLAPIEDDCRCRFRLTVSIAPEAPLGPALLEFDDPSGNLMPLGFEVSEYEEVLEQEPNDQFDKTNPVKLPVIVNGRIDEPGDRDRFRINVNQFDEFTFKVDAHSLGSKMTDANLTLIRPDGALIDRADDRCAACPPFFANVARGERLDPMFWHRFVSGNPNDADAAGDYLVEVVDNSKTFGPDNTYRVMIRPRKPDFRVWTQAESVIGTWSEGSRIPVAAAFEEGFTGKVTVAARNIPAGYSASPVELNPAQPTGEVLLRREKGVPHAPATFQLEFTGAATLEGKEIAKTALTPPFFTERGGAYLEAPRTRVRVRMVEAPLYSLDIEEPFRGFKMELAQGGSIEIPVTVKRVAGFDTPLRFEGVSLPPGIVLEQQPAAPGDARESKVTIVLTADPDKVKLGGHRIALRAEADWQGKQLGELTRGFGLQIR